MNVNKWLVREVDDDNDSEDGGNELVFDDDPTLNWEIVYEALGIREPIVYTWRQTTYKRKQPSNGGIVIVSSHASKKGLGATPTPTQPKKGKKKTQNQVQNELRDSSTQVIRYNHASPRNHVKPTNPLKMLLAAFMSPTIEYI